MSGPYDQITAPVARSIASISPALVALTAYTTVMPRVGL